MFVKNSVLFLRRILYTCPVNPLTVTVLPTATCATLGGHGEIFSFRTASVLDPVWRLQQGMYNCSKNLGVVRVTWDRYHTEGPQILGAT